MSCELKEEIKKLTNVEQAIAHKQKPVQKDQWGSDIEFLLSCITLSVGLGNVWRCVTSIKLYILAMSRLD